MQAPGLDVFCTFIIKAWEKVKTESVIKSFKKCCISNALDGTEDDILWEDDEEEVIDGPSDEADDWDQYYDFDIDHHYVNNYMQDVANQILFD